MARATSIYGSREKRYRQMCRKLEKLTKRHVAKLIQTLLFLTAFRKIGTQCVHVSAIWKFNDHVGKKATHTSRTKERLCFVSLAFWVALWTLESEERE